MSAIDAPRYPAEWELDAVLADGATIHLRPIRDGDASALVAFHAGLSAETVYFRFFAPRPVLPDKDVRRFTHVDYHDRMAFVGVLQEGIVGVARYDHQGDLCRIAAVEPAHAREAGDNWDQYPRLAADLPEVAEMDLNPVMASPSGAVVVDAKVRLTQWQDRPWLAVRHLRGAAALRSLA